MKDWKLTPNTTLNFSIPISDDDYPEYEQVWVDINRDNQMIRGIRFSGIKLSPWQMVLLEKLFVKLRKDGLKTGFDLAFFKEVK